MNMDPQFDNLGWEVRIYNDLTRSTKEQRLAHKSWCCNWYVKFWRGEIISTSFDNTSHDISKGWSQIDFTELN